MYLEITTSQVQGFPGGSDGKESACSVGDLGLIPGLGRSPGEENGYPLQYSCLEDPHGQKSLVGYSPWGHKESDTTERLHFTSLDKWDCCIHWLCPLIFSYCKIS